MPENAIYYQVAYTAAALIYAGYIVSLIVRTRRARDRHRERQR